LAQDRDRWTSCKDWLASQEELCSME
jgi:hypothetical protein